MAQLNFQVPDDLLHRIDSVKPNYLDRKGFLCLLLDQALTGVSKLPAYCVGAGTSSNLQTQADPPNEASSAELPSFSLPEFVDGFPPRADLGDGVGRESEGTPRKPPFTFSVPPDLDWCRDQLLTYWKEGKSGKKSKHAAALLFSGLRSIAEKYGEQVVLEQLELATAKGFDNITLKNYEQFGVPARAASVSVQAKTVDWDAVDHVSFFK
jgi:hypothetical protein